MVIYGTDTVNIGLTDIEHARGSGTATIRDSSVLALNQAGQAIGSARRYKGNSNIRQTAWLYDGTSTQVIGPTDVKHTRDTDGFRFNLSIDMNEAGQVTGFAARYGVGGIDLGQTAWFYDSGTTYLLDGLSETSYGYAFSKTSFLGEDGTVLGYYNLYDEFDVLLGNRAFWFKTDIGLFDLGMQVDEGFNDWASLALTCGLENDACRPNISMCLDGIITGEGRLADMTIGRMSYILTPSPVPVPPAFCLFASAAGLLGWMRRKAI